ncbi:hypothetical protein EDB80DRAFT_700704 [Ilyonectria destructans]|nr:hypothetical protein EDB80DRAFT_700704 [Ilyonectria destructans]
MRSAQRPMRLALGAVVVSARSTVPAGFVPLITSYCFTVITCNLTSVLFWFYGARRRLRRRLDAETRALGVGVC